MLKKYTSKLLPLEEIDDYENPPIAIHFKNPNGLGEWWIVGGEKIPHDNDWYFFGVGEITNREMGFMTLSQIHQFSGELDNNYDGKLKLYDII